MPDDTSRTRSFDELTRGLATGQISRRRAMKLFAATAVAAVVPARALAAKPECRENGQPCRNHEDCCSQYCGSAQRGRARRCMTPPPPV